MAKGVPIDPIAVPCVCKFTAPAVKVSVEADWVIVPVPVTAKSITPDVALVEVKGDPTTKDPPPVMSILKVPLGPKGIPDPPRVKVVALLSAINTLSVVVPGVVAV